MPDKKEPPMAMCHDCPEPLVSTFEFKYKEFLCMSCRRLYEFLSPRAAESTPELEARQKVLQAQYDAEREERRKAGTHGNIKAMLAMGVQS